MSAHSQAYSAQPAETLEQTAVEARCRRIARRHGLAFRKSRRSRGLWIDVRYWVLDQSSIIRASAADDQLHQIAVWLDDLDRARRI